MLKLHLFFHLLTRRGAIVTMSLCCGGDLPSPPPPRLLSAGLADSCMNPHQRLCRPLSAARCSGPSPPDAA